MPASTPLRIWWNNLADATATTVTASEAATGFPASNIQETFRQVRWRSNNVTGTKTVTFDLGSSKALTVAGLLDHNMTSAATVQLRKSSDNFVANDVLVATFTMSRTDDDSETVILDPAVAYITSTSERYWRISIADSGNADGYVEMGRVFLGTYTEMTKNYMVGWGIKPVDLSIRRRSLNGVVHVNVKPQYRTLDLAFRVVTRVQKDAIRKIADSIGANKAAWFDVDPDNAARDLYVIYGRLAEVPRFENTRWNLWSLSLTIEEDV